MTVEELKELAKRQPFEPFTIHMNDGSRLKVSQPDDLFTHRSWKFNALVMLDKGRFSILYSRNIAHVSTRGNWPRPARKRGKSGPTNEQD